MLISIPSVRSIPGVRRVGVLALSCLLLLVACAPAAQHPTKSVPAATPTATPWVENGQNLYTPAQMRAAYGITPLLQRGITGKGQTLVLIESFGSPSVQQDLDVFDKTFHLPPLQVQVLAPLGSVPFDPKNTLMAGWAGETEEDVETFHALAPDARIVILTSPVAETEGTIGLPQFLQLEQYAVAHHLGSIISMSWAASEATLQDAAGQQQVHQWDAFFQQATQQDRLTFIGSSGDNGATDYANVQMTRFATTPTVNFPADEPWVLSAGGTDLTITNGHVSETAWQDSGGGFSQFFAEPSYQQGLPASTQQLAHNRRGLPDVAASADPRSGLAIYIQGQWFVSNGTSAASPTWSAIVALADQMAGHPLGFINPALYQLEAASATRDFRDITSGNNTYAENGVFVQGYQAAPGWDPVTGLGTPDAAHLVPDLVHAKG